MYSRLQGVALPPTTIYLYLTFRCNLRCKMCNQWGDIGTHRGYERERLRAELSVEDVRRLISQVAWFRPEVVLFGGEPLLYPGLAETIQICRRSGILCRVITNGVLLARQAENLVQDNVVDVSVSLDGPADVHDRVRGLQKTFSRACEGIRRVQELKRQRGVDTPTIGVNCTFLPENMERLHELIDVVEELNVDWMSFTHIWFTTASILSAHNRFFRRAFGCESRSWAGFIKDTSPYDLRLLTQVISELRQRQAEGLGVKICPDFTDDEMRGYYTDPRFRPHSYDPRCFDPWLTANVFPTGEVALCPETDYYIGNVRTTPFLRVWNSKRARVYRDVLRKADGFPVCSRCCNMYRNKLWLV